MASDIGGTRMDHEKVTVSLMGVVFLAVKANFCEQCKIVLTIKGVTLSTFCFIFGLILIPEKMSMNYESSYISIVMFGLILFE